MNRKIKMTASVLNAIVEYYGKLLTVRPDVEVIGIYNKCRETSATDRKVELTPDECIELHQGLQNINKSKVRQQEIEEIYFQFEVLRKVGENIEFNPDWANELKRN